MSAARRSWCRSSRSMRTRRVDGGPGSKRRRVRKRPSRFGAASARPSPRAAFPRRAAGLGRAWMSSSRTAAPPPFFSRAGRAERPLQANLINPLGPRILLASRSPRRIELLTLVGAHFTAVPVDIDEQAEPGERAEAHVLRLAEKKARAALERGSTDGARGSWIYVGADTVVTLDRAILGKPTGPEEAAGMLARLSGRIHEVWTGLFLIDADGSRSVGGAL